MRSSLWKTICAAAMCAPLVAAAQQQPSDYKREKRWADQIVPQIVAGEPVWLEAPRTEKFLGIYTEAKNAKSAIILAHGLGVHPDFGLIGELRTRLADAGYTTLSIQMPILAADAPAARYPVLFWEADARFAAAMTHLRRKRYQKIVLLSHSMGSRMANHYVGAHPQVPLAGWISLSISSGEYAPIKRISFRSSTSTRKTTSTPCCKARRSAPPCSSACAVRARAWCSRPITFSRRRKRSSCC